MGKWRSAGQPDLDIDVLPHDNVKDKVQEALGMRVGCILLGYRDVSTGTVAENDIEVTLCVDVCAR